MRLAPFTVPAAAGFLVVLSTSIVNVALPAIRAGLGLTAEGMSWVVNAYGLAFGALLLLGGRLADLFGARRVLLVGLGGFAAGSLGAGLARSAEVLVAARAVQGVAAALLAPAALALVLRLYDGPARGRALGLWGAVSGVGGAVGVLLSGVLSSAFGWPAIFLVAVPVAVAAGAAAFALVPADPPRAGSRRVDVVGALTVTGGLVAVTHGVTSAGSWAWSWAVAGAGVLLLVVFAVTQAKARDALVPPRVFAVPGVAAANAAMALLGAVWVGLFYFLPLYQQQVLDYSALRTGLAQLPLAGAVVVGSTLAPRLTGRLATPLALLALAAGLGWFALGPRFPVDLLGPSPLTGAGLGVAFVHLTAAAARHVPVADAGLAGGLVNTTRQVGGAVGLAALVATTTGAAAPFAAMAGTAAVAAVLVLVTTSTTSTTNPTDTPGVQR